MTCSISRPRLGESDGGCSLGGERATIHMRSGAVGCNLCEAICGLELTIETAGRRRTCAATRRPAPAGHICPKAVALADVHADPDRLRRPVRRTADGWQEIGWDEAFDLVADNLARVIASTATTRSASTSATPTCTASAR